MTDLKTTRWGLNILAIIGLVFAMRMGRTLFLPVVVSLMLAAVLWPMVRYMVDELRFPRIFSSLTAIFTLIICTVLLILGGVLTIQSTVQPLMTSEGQQKLYDRMRQRVGEIDEDLANKFFPKDFPKERTSPNPLQVSQVLLGSASALEPLGALRPLGLHPILPDTSPLGLDPKLVSRLRSMTTDPAEANYWEKSLLFQTTNQFAREVRGQATEMASSVIGQILLVLFLTLFICIEGDMLIRRTVELFGPTTGTESRAAMNALAEMARQVRNYIVWRSVINAGIAIFLGLTYNLLGLQQPWSWAIMAGVLTFVPYVGPIPPALLALLDAFLYQGPLTVIAVLIVNMIVFTVEGYVVFPLVLGRQMEMNATTVMLACLFWYVVWGELGLFLALPLMAALKAICMYVPGWQPFANLMGMEHLDPKQRGALKRMWHGVTTRIVAPVLALVNRRKRRRLEPTPGAMEPSPDGQANEAPLQGAPTEAKISE